MMEAYPWADAGRRPGEPLYVFFQRRDKERFEAMPLWRIWQAWLEIEDEDTDAVEWHGTDADDVVSDYLTKEGGSNEEFYTGSRMYWVREVATGKLFKISVEAEPEIRYSATIMENPW